jgi:hypothetical protein
VRACARAASQHIRFSMDILVMLMTFAVHLPSAAASALLFAAFRRCKGEKVSLQLWSLVVTQCRTSSFQSHRFIPRSGYIIWNTLQYNMLDAADGSVCTDG